MTINRIVGTVAVPGLGLALTGCVVTPVYPFYAEKDLFFVPALMGDWKQPDNHWTEAL